MQLRRRRPACTKARTTSPLTDLDRKQDRAPVPTDWTYAPAPSRATSCGCASATATSSAASGSRRPRVHDTIAPRDEEVLAAIGREPQRTSTPPSARHAMRSRTAGRRSPARSARSTSSASRASSRSAQRVRRARIAERRQADQGVARRRPAARGSALLRLRRLGGQARVRVPEPQARSPSASQGRSSRGTSRC